MTLHQLLYNDMLILHKLYQIYKQYHCLIISLLIVLHETRYDQPEYFWYKLKTHSF